MHIVYILFSIKLGKFYIGLTTDNLQERILKHNTKYHGEHHFTAKTDDWKLYYQIPCISLSQARRIELHLKSMKSKVYIQNLIKYPEISEKLLLKYS